MFKKLLPRIWNTTNMSQLQSLDTGSQVSSIVWNSDYKELITGHGFSQNQLTVWKYPSLSKVMNYLTTSSVSNQVFLM